MRFVANRGNVTQWYVSDTRLKRPAIPGLVFYSLAEAVTAAHVLNLIGPITAHTLWPMQTMPGETDY